MAMTVAQKYVGQIAGFLGLFQGLAWVVISSMCLRRYGTSSTFDTSQSQSYMDFWSYLVSNQFFNINRGNKNQVLAPYNLRIFAAIHLIFSSSWAFVSLFELLAIRHNNLKLPSMLKNWAAITFMIFTYDIMLSFFLILDFIKCSDGYGLTPILNIMQEGLCTTIYIPVLAIVARGFVLGIMNLVFAILIWKIGKNLKMKALKTDAREVRLVIIPDGNDPRISAATSQQRSQSGQPDRNPEPFRNNPTSGGINYNNGPMNPNPYSYRYPYPRNPLPQNWTGPNMGDGYNGGYNERNSLPNSNNPANPQFRAGRY